MIREGDIVGFSNKFLKRRRSVTSVRRAKQFLMQVILVRTDYMWQAKMQHTLVTVKRVDGKEFPVRFGVPQFSMCYDVSWLRFVSRAGRREPVVGGNRQIR